MHIGMDMFTLNERESRGHSSRSAKTNVLQNFKSSYEIFVCIPFSAVERLKLYNANKLIIGHININKFDEIYNTGKYLLFLKLS